LNAGQSTDTTSDDALEVPGLFGGNSLLRLRPRVAGPPVLLPRLRARSRDRQGPRQPDRDAGHKRSRQTPARKNSVHRFGHRSSSWPPAGFRPL